MRSDPLEKLKLYEAHVEEFFADRKVKKRLVAHEIQVDENLDWGKMLQEGVKSFGRSNPFLGV